MNKVGKSSEKGERRDGCGLSGGFPTCRQGREGCVIWEGEPFLPPRKHCKVEVGEECSEDVLADVDPSLLVADPCRLVSRGVRAVSRVYTDPSLLVAVSRGFKVVSRAYTDPSLLVADLLSIWLGPRAGGI